MVISVVLEYFDGCVESFKSAEVQEVVQGELKTVYHHSVYPGLAFLLLLLMDLDALIVPFSWTFVIYSTSQINKNELTLFEKFATEVYKSKIIWVKIGALVLGLFAAKAAAETIEFVEWVLGDKTFLLIPILYYLKKSLLKWMAFIQYFCFYRAYLYIFMAFGSYINPKIKKIRSGQENAEKEEGKKSQ